MIKTKPYGYQTEGVRLLQKKCKGRGLLADDMGLGKSLQAIMFRDKYVEGGPTVVVCPANIKYQWQQEFWDHARVRAQVIEGRTPPKYNPATFRPKGVFIINYDLLGDPKRKHQKTWVRFFKKLKPKFLIGDEIHYCQNKDTQRSRAMVYLSSRVKQIILMSGTPATSFPSQFWVACKILRPKKFKSFYSFAHQHCDPQRTRFGWTYKGATNLGRLREKLKPFMVRRRKSEVLKDLPAKTRTVIPVDIKKPKDYKLAEKDLIKWLTKHGKNRQAFRAMSAERLVRLGYLRRLAAELKLSAVIDWIKEFLTTGKKLIVFGIHKKILRAIREAFPGQSVLVTGETSPLKRQMMVDAFNKDKKVRLFLGNIDAAGSGWSCKSASDVLFVELPWVPGKLSQAEDRIHGVGRGVAGRKAMVHYIVAHSTIETLLLAVLQKKQRNLTAIMDGEKHVAKEGTANVLDLLEMALTTRGLDTRNNKRKMSA